MDLSPDAIRRELQTHTNSLAKKTALVTGATSGIGEACCYLLGELGVHLKILGRRADRLQTLQTRLSEMFSELQVESFPADVTSLADRQRLAKSGAFQADILINNAGLALGLSDIHDADEQHWEQMIATNVSGAFSIARSCLRHMRKNGYGHVVNIGSVAGHSTYDKGSVYCATKHALRAFTKVLRSEECGNNIRVTLISPGMVETEFSLVRFEGDAEKAKTVYDGMTPLTAWDIGREIAHVLQAPSNVNIDEVTITPQQQGSVHKTVRR